MNGRAIVALSPDLIRDLLHMPATASIVGAWWGDDRRHIEVLVESPDLPAEESIRTIEPTVTHHVERYEWSWGIEVPSEGDKK